LEVLSSLFFYAVAITLSRTDSAPKDFVDSMQARKIFGTWFIYRNDVMKGVKSAAATARQADRTELLNHHVLGILLVRNSGKSHMLIGPRAVFDHDSCRQPLWSFNSREHRL
jgi:hypothetical protein